MSDARVKDQGAVRRFAPKGATLFGATLIGATVALTALLPAAIASAAPGGRDAGAAGAAAAAEARARSGASSEPSRSARRLASVLGELERTRAREGAAAARRIAERRMLRVRDDRVRVVLVVARDRRAGAAALVRGQGGKALSRYRGLLLADVPIGRLSALAKTRGVLAVRPPARPRPHVTSQGVVEIGATTWHAAGLNGAGVKVGVIDLGFSGYPAKLGSELPATVVTWGGSAAGPENGGDVHGTAVAETVHDVAPGASLYLARIDNEVELGSAKDWMKAQGVKVVNHSVGWFGTEGGDGRGVINGIVSDAVSSGLFWANSAGNGRLGHWMGDFTDSDADGILNWDATTEKDNTFWALESDATTNYPIVGYLWWDDSWSNASQDYDLYLYRRQGSTWRLVASSVNWQDGGAGRTPVEYVGVYAPATATYAWRIVRYSATRTDVDFDLHSWYHDLDDPTNASPHFFDHARSISVPADNGSAGFMAAAAIGRSPGFAQEYYSSEGPTRDGRLAPEMALPASTANSVYGVFAGTSASSPHLAGVAALVRQAFPLYSPADVESYVRAQGVDLGAAGPDYLYGYGRVLLPAAPIPDTTPPVGGFVLAGGDAYTSTTTVSVDSSVTGATQMRFDNGSGYGPWVPYAAGSSVTVTVSEGTKLVLGQYKDEAANVLSASDEIVLVTAVPPAWTYPTGATALGNPTAHPVIGALFVSSNDGLVRALRLDTGALRWAFSTSGPVQNQTAVYVSGSPTVLAASQGGYLYAIDDSGGELWKVGLAGDYDPGSKTFAAPGADDHLQGGVGYLPSVPISGTNAGVVYAGTYNDPASDNAFYALSATSSAVLWRDARPGTQFVSSFPGVDPATLKVVYATYQGHVYALEAGTGTPLWDRSLAATITGSPTIYGGVVLVGAGDTLHLLDLGDGGTVRTVTPSAGAWTLGTPWPAPDSAYVSSTKGSVYKIQTSTGAVLAEASGLAYPRLPVKRGARLYVGTNEGLRTLDDQLGRLSTLRPGEPLASPALQIRTGQPARAFFGDAAGVVSACDVRDDGMLVQASGAAASGAASAARALTFAGGQTTARAATRWKAPQAGKDAAVTLSARREAHSLVVELSAKRSGSRDPYRLALFEPGGGLYDARVFEGLDSRRGISSAVWRVPISGTWAEQLPGAWLVTAERDGAVRAVRQVEIR